MSNPVENDLKRLQAELAQLREDVSKVAAALRDAVHHGASQAFTNGKTRAEDLHTDLRDGVEALTGHIEDKPVASALVSFVTGLMLGILVGGRRS